MPESKLHINFLELKAVLLALKCFKHLCRDKTVLIASDNTTVVAYINKEGLGGNEIRLSLCPFLETPVMVQPEKHCPAGSPYSRPVERDSGQAIPSQPIYPNRIVSQPGDIQSDLPLVAHTRSLSPDSTRNFPWAVDTEHIMGGHGRVCLYPTPLIANVINKILSHDCPQIIVIAPCWPNMLWFWDLVNLSTQISLCLPYQPTC